MRSVDRIATAASASELESSGTQGDWSLTRGREQQSRCCSLGAHLGRKLVKLLKPHHLSGRWTEKIKS